MSIITGLKPSTDSFKTPDLDFWYPGAGVSKWTEPIFSNFGKLKTVCCSNDCNEWPLTVKKTEDTCKVKPSACGQVKKNTSTAYIFNLLSIAITKNTVPIFCNFGKSKTVLGELQLTKYYGDPKKTSILHFRL